MRCAGCPRGFVSITLWSARCSIELDLSHYIMTGFFVQEAMGKEALMNFQRQLQFVWTRLSSVSPEYWHADPAPNQFLLEQAFLWCLRVSTLDPGKLGSSLTQEFSSLELINPQVNSKGRSQMKALSLNGVGKVEIAQSFLFLQLPVEHWTIGTGGSGGSALKLL